MEHLFWILATRLGAGCALTVIVSQSLPATQFYISHVNQTAAAANICGESIDRYTIHNPLNSSLDIFSTAWLGEKLSNKCNCYVKF